MIAIAAGGFEGIGTEALPGAAIMGLEGKQARRPQLMQPRQYAAKARSLWRKEVSAGDRRAGRESNSRLRPAR